MSLLHFLLIYDHEQQKLVDQRDYGTQGDEAAQAYSEYERKHRDEKGIEIVLVGADSIETIRKTHAHYFEGDALDPFSELVAGAGR